MQAVRGAQKYPNRGFCPYHIHRSKFVPNPITASRIPPQCALRTKSVHRVQNTTILHSEQSVCQIINRMVGIRPTFLLRHLPPRLVFDRTYRALGNIIRSPRRRRYRRFFFLIPFFFFLFSFFSSFFFTLKRFFFFSFSFPSHLKSFSLFRGSVSSLFPDRLGSMQMNFLFLYFRQRPGRVR